MEETADRCELYDSVLSSKSSSNKPFDGFAGFKFDTDLGVTSGFDESNIGSGDPMPKID